MGYLESYVHGGTITATEVHVPGRPEDPTGVKVLALAAAACFRDYRPGGMRVHAGSVILEPGLLTATIRTSTDLAALDQDADDVGVEPVCNPPDGMKARIEADLPMWRETVQISGATLD